jgi:hypothetical protein
MTDHNNRPDIVMFRQTFKEACLIDLAIPSGHNLHNTITEKFQRYTELTEDITRAQQLNMIYVTSLVISTNNYTTALK